MFFIMIKETKDLKQRTSTVEKALALHMAVARSIHLIPYGSQPHQDPEEKSQEYPKHTLV